MLQLNEYKLRLFVFFCEEKKLNILEHLSGAVHDESVFTYKSHNQEEVNTQEA